MMPANDRRSSRSANKRFMSETITMVVVRLSKMALKKKVKKPTSHISVDRRVVLIRAVSTSKPSCASTTSTIAMAAIKKKTICAVPISDSPSCVFTSAASLWDMA